MDKKNAYDNGMGIYKDLMAHIKGRLNAGEKQSEIARQGRVLPMYVNRLIKGQRKDNIQRIFSFIDSIGGRLVFDKNCRELSKPVYFVKPRIVSSLPVEGPVDEDYIAVPLASMPVAAGIGMIPEESIKSWVLVWKGQDSVRHRSNLAAVEVGRGQVSMIPTLHPGDIVLIDRNDFRPDKGSLGNIFLVQEPPSDGGGLAIKRVTLQKVSGKSIIMFSSDNLANETVAYDLDTEYQGDISCAIKGRVVWSWSDMTKK